MYRNPVTLKYCPAHHSVLLALLTQESSIILHTIVSLLDLLTRGVILMLWMQTYEPRLWSGR